MKNTNKTEKVLEEISPQSMPLEVKERILKNADLKKREFRVLSPAYRILFAVSCVLLLVVFFSNHMIQKRESRYVASLMNGSQVSESVIEKDLKEATEDHLRIEYSLSFNQWLTRHYKIHRKEGKLRNYQDILDILEEEINGV